MNIIETVAVTRTARVTKQDIFRVLGWYNPVPSQGLQPLNIPLDDSTLSVVIDLFNGDTEVIFTVTYQERAPKQTQT